MLRARIFCISKIPRDKTESRPGRQGPITLSARTFAVQDIALEIYRGTLNFEEMSPILSNTNLPNVLWHLAILVMKCDIGAFVTFIEQHEEEFFGAINNAIRAHRYLPSSAYRDERLDLLAALRDSWHIRLGHPAPTA